MPLQHGLDGYLEAIYVLHAEGEQVIASRVADYLSVSRPTVSQTLQRLQKEKFATVSETREIVLTEVGMERAEEIIRKHRLLERWLTDVLGLDWADAHVEAARLESSISPLVESRLEELLGHPTTCPHGNVIPGSGYVEPKGAPLSTLEEACAVEVIRIFEVAEEDLDLLRFLHKSGIVPGATIEIEPQSRFEAGVAIRVRGEAMSLDLSVAERIIVNKRSA